jgi:glycosyltransferase involved in cell wall biosynthesis
MNEPLVSICCLAFNHELFIRQCIEGFMMQKTNFKFEILIHDDASTDNTAEIIKEYEYKFPDIIKPIYQSENQYSKGIGVSRVYQFPRAQGKYIALCEGDDYWTDPLKLQKQVNFLEANPLYGLVHTDYYNYNERLQKFVHDPVLTVWDTGGSSQYEELLKGNRIGTLTVCFRSEILKKYSAEIKPENQNWLMGDYPLWLFISNFYKIHYISEKMAVYRGGKESGSFSIDRRKGYDFLESIYNIKFFFIKKYGCSQKTKESIENDYLIDTIKAKIKMGFYLRDIALIDDCLMDKRKNNLNVTLLDKAIRFSSTVYPIWLLSRTIIHVRSFLNEHSSKYKKSMVNSDAIDSCINK